MGLMNLFSHSRLAIMCCMIQYDKSYQVMTNRVEWPNMHADNVTVETCGSKK